MAIAMLSWLVAMPLLGFATGLRSMTPIAVFCWFAYSNQIPANDDWAMWTMKLTPALVFTALAVGEYIADKLPWIPSRTSLASLLVRVVFGGGVCALAAGGLDGSVLEGIILGSLGALLGAFIGYHVRHDLVYRQGWKDWRVALAEDAIAILLAVFAMGVITA